MDSISSLLSDASEADKRKLHQLHTAVCAWVSMIASGRSLLPRRLFGVVHSSKEEAFFRRSFDIVNTRQEKTLFANESNKHGTDQTYKESNSSRANGQQNGERATEQRLLMLRKPSFSKGLMVLHVGLARCFSTVITELIKTCRTYLTAPFEHLGEDHSSIHLAIEDEDGRMHEAYVLDVYLHVSDYPGSNPNNLGHPRPQSFAADRYEELILLCNALQILFHYYPQLQVRSQARVYFHHTSTRDSTEQTKVTHGIVPDYTHMSSTHNRTITVSQWRLVSSVYSLPSGQEENTDVI